MSNFNLQLFLWIPEICQELLLSLLPFPFVAQLFLVWLKEIRFFLGNVPELFLLLLVVEVFLGFHSPCFFLPRTDIYLLV